MDDDPRDVPPTAPGSARARRVAYENPWLTRLARRRHPPDGAPGIYGVVHFANLAAGVLVLDARRPGPARRPASLHARCLLVGDPGRRRSRRRDGARRRATRAPRGDRRRGGRVAGARPGPSLEQRHRRARGPVPRDRADPWRGDAGRHRGPRDPLAALRGRPRDDPRRVDQRRDDGPRRRAPGAPASTGRSRVGRHTNRCSPALRARTAGLVRSP